MLSHLIKLMWNKRRANSLIFLEIFLAFVVLFGVYAFLFYNFERYSSPLGFSYENSIGVRVDLPDDLDSLAAMNLQERIRRDLLDLGQVEGVTWIGPVNPFGGSTWQTSTTVDDVVISTQMMFVDEHFQQAAEMDVIDGHWFTVEDYEGKYRPIVINQEYKDRYFPNVGTLVDSIIGLSGSEHIIVGMTGDFKYQSNFAENVPLTFFSQLERMQGEEKDPFEMLIVRLRPNTLAEVEETIYNRLVSATKNTEVVIWDMAKDRVKSNRDIVIPIVILTVISAFLLVNIALGLFGVLFTQINRRRAEIGLRKAMGATNVEITTQFVLEVLLVAISALILGTFFTIQIPLLDLTPIPDSYFYFGIVGAILTIVTIVTLCALLPSSQAARLQPATVLHEE